MAIRRCEINGEEGWKWTDQGRCHIGEGALERAEADKRRDIERGAKDSRGRDWTPQER